MNKQYQNKDQIVTPTNVAGPSYRFSGRDTTETNTSQLTATNLRKYQNVQQYLREMFGEQFVTLVGKASQVDNKRSTRFAANSKLLADKRDQLSFPDYNSYPY